MKTLTIEVSARSEIEAMQTARVMAEDDHGLVGPTQITKVEQTDRSQPDGRGIYAVTIRESGFDFSPDDYAATRRPSGANEFEAARCDHAVNSDCPHYS